MPETAAKPVYLVDAYSDPVVVRIDDTEFFTALFPKDGRYLIPLKDKVRRAEGIEVDQVVTVSLRVGRE